MCSAGLEVLDIYPFTRSYPEGTGGPEVAFYKEQDIVHFKFHVMKALDVFIEEYLRGQVTFPIDATSYMFQWLMPGRITVALEHDPNNGGACVETAA